MAKIPQYAQDQLASSVVGTPGVDKTASMLGNALDESTGQMAGALFATNQAMRNEADQNYLEVEARQRQDQAKVFDAVGNEIQQRMYVQQRQDAYDLAQLQAEQKERERVQRNAIQEQAASNANLAFDLKTADILSEVKNNKDLLPEKAPMIVQQALTRQRDEMMRGLSPEVATKFNSHANTQIANHYKEVSKEALTAATNKVMADRKQLEDATVLKVQNEAGFLKFADSLNSDAERETMLRVYGDKAGARQQELLKDAAENMLRGYTNKGNPEKAKELLESGDYDFLGETKKQALQSHTDAAIKAKEADYERVEKLSDDLKGEEIVNKLKSDPDSPTYYKDLVHGRQQIVDMLSQEMAKPIRQPGDPLYDKETGERIEYQRPPIIKALSENRNQIDKQIHAEQAEKKRDDKAAAAEKKADAKEAARENKSIVQEAAAENWEAGAGLREKLSIAMGALKSHSIPPTSDNKKPFHTTHKTAAAYFQATEAYRRAERAGALDMPGSRTKPSTMLLRELTTIGERLRGGAKDPLDKGLTEMSLHRLNSAAPQGLAKILDQWHGRSATSTNYEYTARMLRAYDLFKEANPNLEPSESVVADWQARIDANMKKRAARTPTGKK